MLVDNPLLSSEILKRIIPGLSKPDLMKCSLVSKSWQVVADQDHSWTKAVPKAYWKEKETPKQIFVDYQQALQLYQKQLQQGLYEQLQQLQQEQLQQEQFGFLKALGL